MSEEKKKGKKKGHGSHKNHVSLRLTVKDAIDKHMYPSAAFFASKLSLGDEDMYTSAMTNFMARQYGEAIKVILKRFKQPARYRYLRAKCHVELEEWNRCLELFTDIRFTPGGELTCLQDVKDMDNVVAEGVDYPKISMLSAMCCLKGQAYRGLGMNSNAIKWYQAALKANFWCYEAVVSLTSMLLHEQQVELLSPLLRQSIMAGWTLPLYSSLIKKENIVDDEMKPTLLFARVATYLIWDLENMHVLHGLDFTIGRMRKRMVDLGYTGPLSIIVVIGLETNIPAAVLLKLTEWKERGDIKLVVVGSDSKQASDCAIREILNNWSDANEAPSNLWIVAGDEDFPSLVKDLVGHFCNIGLGPTMLNLVPFHSRLLRFSIYKWRSIACLNQKDCVITLLY